MNRSLTAFAIAVGAATVLSWFGRWHALLEMLTNIPLHMLVISIVLMVWALVAWRPAHALVGLVATVWFAFLLLPYALATEDVRPSDPSEVYAALQYNVFFDNESVDDIVAEINEADADIVALHEITTPQWQALQARLDDYPHTIAEPWDGGELQLGGGMALLSRAPLEPLEVDADASVEGRPILAAVTSVGTTDVVVVGLHPHASRFESHKVELRDLQLAAVAEMLRDERRPALILTDLNMTPTSSDYRKFLDDLDWRDPHRTAGWDASWPSWGGPFGLPIDHVLVSDQIALHDITSSSGGGSDHRSLTAEFSLPG